MFDMVCYDALRYKIVRSGLQGGIIDIIKNMYAHVNSCMVSIQAHHFYYDGVVLVAYVITWQSDWSLV